MLADDQNRLRTDGLLFIQDEFPSAVDHRRVMK